MIALMKHKRSSKQTRPSLGPEAVLGAIALFVQPWLLTLRASDLAESLKHGHIPNREIAFAAFGAHYTAGTCAVAGVALTLAQMLSASVFTMDTSNNPRHRYLKGLAGSGWLILLALELASSVLYADGGMPGQLTAFVFALLFVLFESVGGILIIDCLIIPAARTIERAIHDAKSRRLKRLRSLRTAVDVSSHQS